jgi:hypothetical protein
LRLVIRAAGIRKPIATLESHDELPQLARLRRTRRPVPHQTDARRDSMARLLNVEQELRIADRIRRERRNVAAHEQIATFQRRRQIARCAAGGAQPCPAQSREQSCNELESPDDRQRERCREQTDRAVPVRQPRQGVNAASPQQKCERNSPHPDLPV